MFVTTISGRATSRSGSVPTQYLTQKSDLTSSGDERISHIIRPSRDIAGNTKRAAIAATTNPARPRLRKETRLIRKKDTFSPL